MILVTMGSEPFDLLSRGIEGDPALRYMTVVGVLQRSQHRVRWVGTAHACVYVDGASVDRAALSSGRCLYNGGWQVSNVDVLL